MGDKLVALTKNDQRLHDIIAELTDHLKKKEGEVTAVEERAAAAQAAGKEAELRAMALRAAERKQDARAVAAEDEVGRLQEQLEAMAKELRSAAQREEQLAGAVDSLEVRAFLHSSHCLLNALTAANRLVRLALLLIDRSKQDELREASVRDTAQEKALSEAVAATRSAQREAFRSTAAHSALLAPANAAKMAALQLRGKLAISVADAAAARGARNAAVAEARVARGVSS